MSYRLSIAALCLSLLAHALLIAAATKWLAQSRASPAPPQNVLTVALKPPSALPAAPAPPSAPLPAAQPIPTPKPVRKAREKRKPGRSVKPVVPPSEPPLASHSPSEPQAGHSPLSAQAPPARAAASSPAPAPEPSPSPAPASAPPVRTGVSIPASYASANRPPDYPALSRRYGEQGTVILKVLVKADGTAGAVEIGKSSGYPLLDAAAKNTVRSWRFHPATSDGKPVAEWYPLPITFTLRE